jgi:dolichol-phosphate mannosyltransferase
MPERNRFLRGMIIWTGFRQAGIPFERPPRFAGKSKADFGSVFKLAMDGIFSFSYFPLRVITALGIFLAIVSFVMLCIYVALFFILGREVPGFTTLITIVLFMFGTLFFILGIIGEYIARIYDETKQRPNFVIRNKVGFEDIK